MEFNLDSLTQETLQLSQKNLIKNKMTLDRLDDNGQLSLSLGSEGLDYFADLTSSAEVYDPFENNDDNNFQIPDSPGVLYFLDNGVSTFCARAIATEDLEWSFEQLKNKNIELVEKLKLNDDSSYDDIRFFETKNIEQAQVIVDQLGNKRFPREEGLLCNLSDPGFSWWMDSGPGFIQIYFQSQSVNREQLYTRLGPLGDNIIAELRFSQLEQFLRQIIPINEFSSTAKSFSICSVKENSGEFEGLKELFLTGELDPSFLSKVDLTKTLKLFLEEISLVRRFWLEIN